MKQQKATNVLIPIQTKPASLWNPTYTERFVIAFTIPDLLEFILNRVLLFLQAVRLHIHFVSRSIVETKRFVSVQLRYWGEWVLVAIWLVFTGVRLCLEDAAGA